MAHSDITARPTQLHVIHDLGGGSAKWLADYVRADRSRTNRVLRSFAHGSAAASGIALYADAASEAPLRAWKFAHPIAAAVTEHPEYRAALAEALAGQGVEALVVSSLIGHSLEVLDTGLPTVVVSHDYFPWCPAINLNFEGACERCDGERVGRCEADNARFSPFAGYAPEERLRVRERFMELIARPHVTLAAPSDSVARNLRRLDPRFEPLAFHTIAHGYGEPLRPVAFVPGGKDERLRVLVLGQLSVAKGLEVLRGALEEITRFADLWLVGCRELGELFKHEPHVHVVSRYELAELPAHVANIRPHLGLLMSVVPETFSYALSELLMLGVPPAATRLGSFPERIRHGETGYLYEPEPRALVALLDAIDADRDTLERIRSSIAGWTPRSPEEMVAEYHALTPLRARTLPEGAPPPSPTPAQRAAAEEAATLASMWKHVKSLDLQLSMVNEARHRTEQAARASQEELQAARRRLGERDALLAQKDMRIQILSSQVEAQGAKLTEIYASTSWRVSSPVRLVGGALPAARAVARGAWVVAREPGALARRYREAREAWREHGLGGVRKLLFDLQSGEQNRNSWLDYRAAFERDVRPRLAARVKLLPRRPLVSILVPTFNPVEDMLRQMLDSVLAQIYPDWELCVADDASTEPYVRAVLQEYADREPRIRLHFGPRNRGVSHASNQALALATGEFAVLLDHDDILEEQALLRVAESILEDEPDFLYSDEALVTPDGNTVMRYAYRPAFSPEYLRAHPYIVHLAGLRTDLLRRLGGWDESLRISQDYDLVLRATEQARTVVHIPEILYRWRIHGSSAGIGRQGEVMETSRGVLRRHLERCGEAGSIADGDGFNLFEARYPLQAGLKVAIIIPTRDHGELLRQCIESIRATVSEVDYDIVVVDHESRDPETVAYLASLAPGVRVVRFEGTFNFSLINNRAVAALPPGYTHYLLCNNDIEAYEPGWLGRMLELAQSPRVGIVGPTLYYPDRKTIQHAGVCVGMFGAAEHYGKRLRIPEDPVEIGYGELLRVNREVAAVTAACLLVRADAFAEIGGFDEAIAVGFGDIDFCLRVGERGYRVVFCPHARLVHHESFTRGVSDVDPHPEDSSLYRVKWKQLMRAGDPYYNPGLSLTSTAWAIRQPLPVRLDVQRRVVRRDREAQRDHVGFSKAPPPQPRT